MVQRWPTHYILQTEEHIFVKNRSLQKSHHNQMFFNENENNDVKRTITSNIIPSPNNQVL